MKFLKEFWEKLKLNPIARTASIFLGVFLLIVIIIILIASCSKDRTYTYSELENKMVDLAKARYKNKKNDLPKNDKDMIEISLQSFIDNGNLKSTQEITTKKSVCTGNVKIINNNGYYLYIPYLDCGNDYKTTTIHDILTQDENIVTNGNGLYFINNEYIFKGDNVNNFISLNNTLYRILKINEDETIRIIDLTKRNSIIWDNRYNVDKKSNIGINNFYYNNLNSRIKDTIESIYNNEFTDSMKSFFVNSQICIGKRSINDNVFDNNIECSDEIENYPFSLIKANEFYMASLDVNCTSYNSPSCSNYNYLTEINNTWTITADKDSSYKVYKISGNDLTLSNASSSSSVKIVTTLNKDLIVEKGTGTQTDPYVIKTFTKQKDTSK